MKQHSRKILRITLLSLLLAALFGSAGFYFWVLKDLPDPSALPERLNQPSIRIQDRNGQLLYEVLSQEESRHTAVPLEQIPLALRQAVIATEDKTFYHNPGVDAQGILRSAWINLRGGETLAGGSTITQQVTRNLLFDPQERGQRTLRRKLREGVLAWRITRRFSKDEILALYLNQTYFGQMSIGVEAATQTYFGKSVTELDLAESALLAGLPQAPSLYNPFVDMDAARERQKVVLGLMEKENYITAEQRELAAHEPLILAVDPFPMEAPHFVIMVRSQLDSILSPEEIHSGGGWTVRTTLDMHWQHLAENAITNQLERLRAQSDDPLAHNIHNAALVALNPSTGEILAMVGSPDYNDSEHAGAVNMTLAPRQPGSALKPLIYAAAFDPANPRPWTPATMILDVTTHFTTHESKPYTPVNYDGLEHGPVLAREALASSLNIPAVIALDHVGLPKLYAFASRLGITTLGDPNHADLSVALGGGEVRLLDLTAAYGTFATGGYRVKPVSILEIMDQQGNTRYRAEPPAKERLVDERVAWLVSDILSDDNARLLGFGRDSVLRLDRPAAVKTGTTTNFHDNWTVGYTPSLVVGVWAGNANHEAMHNITGLTGAAPIWAQMMRSVLSGQPKQDFTRPEGLARVEVCSLSGLLPTPACLYRKTEWFIEGTQPLEEDNLYRLVELDSATGSLAGGTTPPERRVTAAALDLPAQAERWARAQGMLLVKDLTVLNEPPNLAENQPGAEPSLRLLSPPPNAIYHLASGLPAGTQQIHLAATSNISLRQVALWVDGEQIALLDQPPYETWWALEPGRHEAWAEAVLISGERLASERIFFEVK